VYDQPELVQSSLSGVGRAVLIGAFFVVLVLFTLLGDLRAALVVTRRAGPSTGAPRGLGCRCQACNHAVLKPSRTIWQLEPEHRRRAGHYEILGGETYAKFEFFQKGWNPYSRFLDVDKVDLVLRRTWANVPEYREVQVKFGKLYRLFPLSSCHICRNHSRCPARRQWQAPRVHLARSRATASLVPSPGTKVSRDQRSHLPRCHALPKKFCSVGAADAYSLGEDMTARVKVMSMGENTEIAAQTRLGPGWPRCRFTAIR
jgi:hypothetical protein